MLGSIIIGFLTALLYCAIIILVAFAFVWALKFLGIEIDGNVYKWGKVVVALICIIVMLTWAWQVGSRYFRLGSADRGHAASATWTTVHMPRMLSARA